MGKCVEVEGGWDAHSKDNKQDGKPGEKMTSEPISNLSFICTHTQRCIGCQSLIDQAISAAQAIGESRALEKALKFSDLKALIILAKSIEKNGYSQEKLLRYTEEAVRNGIEEALDHRNWKRRVRRTMKQLSRLKAKAEGGSE